MNTTDDPPRIRVCVRQCSWCKQFYHGGGAWMPNVPLGMKDDDIEITHGICGACKEEQCKRLKS